MPTDFHSPALQAAASEAKERISQLNGQIEQLQAALEKEKNKTEEGRRELEAAREEGERQRQRFDEERGKLGRQFSEQLDKYAELEELLASEKARVQAKEAEMSSLHSDFDERMDYVDELARQKLQQQEEAAAERLKEVCVCV